MGCAGRRARADAAAHRPRGRRGDGPRTGHRPADRGRVVAIEELTGFKKPIRACLVDVGESQSREIICGATNFIVNDLVVVALPGTALPGGLTITARKAYGRNSAGMICSAAELGMGADHSGILVLPPGTAAPGADGAEVLGFDDVVFHLAITPTAATACRCAGWPARSPAPTTSTSSTRRRAAAPGAGPAWPLTVQPETGCAALRCDR
ncbi:putative tRNA binding domain protein [Mycobacterium xenopi 4042]|uniref:Putative tRNA binding domain protein n=1 Tax=Mycobacterium xenopi 4042 TaxID=1299334 RepID=X8DC18_MYCXE|nr:putative tRNA binding domain protein [Mycobacterium xenopi 4042]